MNVDPDVSRFSGEALLRAATLDAVSPKDLMRNPEFSRLIHLQDPALVDDPESLLACLETALQWQGKQVRPVRRGNMPLSRLEQAIWAGRLILNPNGKPGEADHLNSTMRIAAECDDMDGVHPKRLLKNLGQYWKAYVAELDSYLKMGLPAPDEEDSLRRRNRHRGPREFLPAERRLLGLSQQLLGAVGELAGAGSGPAAASALATSAPEQMYVRRSIQDGIVNRLGDREAGPAVEVVVGEAGHGKSTLLWGIHNDMKARARTLPILISAAWLRAAPGHDALVSHEEIPQMVAGLRDAGHHVVVLLDTADLLLHNERARLELIELVKDLQLVGTDVVMTTRPAEALFLPPGLGHTSQLGEYSPAEELPKAIRALARAHCRDEDPEHVVQSLGRAVARGLPVATVCQSPLMLRMLFELSAPSTPSIEIDVTALYGRYWKHRVVQDLGPGRDIDHARTDLSYVAGRVALAMLAAGSPEIQDDELPNVDTVGPDAYSTRKALEILVGRGVLVRSGDYFRFFHQTMFEFAAAMALGQGNAKKAFEVLLQRMIERPTDLFVGAVLEQSLILSGRQRAKREIVRRAVAELLESEQESLQSIGIVAWAHHPWLPSPRDSIFIDLPVEVARSFVRVVPRVADIAISDVETQFTAIWQREDAGLCYEVLEAMGRLKERFPEAVATCFAKLNCMEFYLTKHQAGLDNPALVRLVNFLAKVDAELARTALLKMLRGLGSKAGRTTFLRILAQIRSDWPLIGTSSFAIQLAELIDKTQARKNTSTRSVREALGGIFLANLNSKDEELGPQDQNQGWMDRADTYCRDLEANPTATLPGAQLATLALYANTLTDESPLLAGVLDRVMSTGGKQPLRQLPTNFLAIILSTQSQAASLLIPRTVGWLGHLPVVPNELRTQEELLASIARATITDTRVSPTNLKAILDGLPVTRQTQTWTRADWLVAALPAAVSAGVQQALDVVGDIVKTPNLLDPQSATTFLEKAPDYLSENPELVDAFVAVALQGRTAGAIRRALTVQEDMADQNTIAAELSRHSDQLTSLGHQLLEGHGGNQSAGAELLRELQIRQVIDLKWEALESLLARATHPQAIAVLLRLIPHATHGADQTPASIQFIDEMATIRDGQICLSASPDRKPHSSVANALRDSWMTLLGRSQDSRNLPKALQICVMPLAGTGRLDTVGFPELTRLISSTARQGNVSAAIEALLDAGSALVSHEYSSKQQRNASNVLARVLIPILEADSLEAGTKLLNSLTSIPPTLAIFSVRAICQVSYIQHRATLEELLASDIAPKVKTEIVRELRRRGDPEGTNLFPEVSKLT